MITTKLSKLKTPAARNDWRAALAIAARFQDLGNESANIKRAHEAAWHPAFARQIGKDPDALIAAGIEALCRRYQIPIDQPAWHPVNNIEPEDDHLRRVRPMPLTRPG